MSVSLLAEQYRMHPAISAWPSSYFYAGYLKDAPAVLGNSRSAPFHQTPCFPPLAFFDCRCRYCFKIVPALFHMVSFLEYTITVLQKLVFPSVS